jgi:hypothetical protein
MWYRKGFPGRAPKIGGPLMREVSGISGVRISGFALRANHAPKKRQQPQPLPFSFSLYYPDRHFYAATLPH